MGRRRFLFESLSQKGKTGGSGFLEHYSSLIQYTKIINKEFPFFPGLPGNLQPASQFAARSWRAPRPQSRIRTVSF